MVKIPRIPKKIDINLLKTRIKTLRNTSKTLGKLAKEPIPKKLTATQQKEVGKFNQWLERSSKKLDELADSGEDLVQQMASGGSDQAKLMLATQQMQEMNQSFNLQYLKLQEKMQGENRQFTAISNIMKVKHDTAKSAINNVR